MSRISGKFAYSGKPGWGKNLFRVAGQVCNRASTLAMILHNLRRVELFHVKCEVIVAMAEAILALADGRVFRGEAFGAIGNTVGEVCFNTSMTGYGAWGSGLAVRQILRQL